MIPERYAPQVYALFRIVAGFLFIFHGLQKFGLLGGQAVPLASLFGVAAIIETVGGLLVMIGLFTRPAAFVASGEMAVAYFMAHQPKGTWPVQNQGEVAVLYCFAFLYIAARGAGLWSADAAMRSSR
jgi:putative oxidoreductase